MIYLYTDGSWILEHGRVGGWAYRYIYKNKIYKGSGGAFDTTNNKMEMIAAIEGLNRIIDNNHDSLHKITVFTDSQYLVNGAMHWVDRWRKRNWITRAGHPVKNRDLWEEIEYLSDELGCGIVWKWVKGHSGNAHNEAVDVAARHQATIMKRKLGYE